MDTLRGGAITDSISLKNSFYDAIGHEASTLNGRVTEASAEDMKVKDLYTEGSYSTYDVLDESWDFKENWKIDEGTTTPYLRNNISEEKPVP